MNIQSVLFISLLNFFLGQLLATTSIEILPFSGQASQRNSFESMMPLVDKQKMSVPTTFHHEKFAKKSVLISSCQVQENIFWNDLVQNLEEYINFIKKENKVFRLFSRKKLHLANLVSVRKVTSTLEAMWKMIEDSSGQSLEQLDIPALVSQQELIEKQKSIAWEESMQFYRSKKFGYMFKRGACILFSYVLIMNDMVEHLQRSPPNFEPFDIIYVVAIPIIVLALCSVCGVCLWSGIRHDKIYTYLCFFVLLIDYSAIIPISRILVYEIKGFLCNPLGLLLPFWHYITMRRFLHFSKNPEYKKLIDLIEKEKKLVIKMGETKKRVEVLCKILEQEQKVPKEVGREIASFVDVGLAIFQVYSDEISKLSSVYHDDIASLPISQERSLKAYKSLNRRKKASIVLLILLILVDATYFGCAIFSVMRATKRWLY